MSDIEIKFLFIGLGMKVSLMKVYDRVRKKVC